jgi:SOS-response transcriptional repressor LexA
MVDTHQTASKLKAFRLRSGLSMQALARQIGLKGASSYQRYENPANYERKHFLPFEICKKIARAFDGLGQPSIAYNEVLELGGLDYTFNAPVQSYGGFKEADHMEKMAFDHHMTKDLPVLGVAVGGETGFFELNGNVVDYVERPSTLFGAENAYAIYLIGTSMEPKYEEGQTLYVHPDRPARARDYVVVEFLDGRAMVKRLIKRSTDSITIEQFNPAKRIDIEADQVKAVHKVVAADELG